MKIRQVQNFINHFVLVVDESSSMGKHRNKLIQAVDSQIMYLAKRSKEMNQETRVTVYTFSYSSRIKCLIYDMDVLRVPSIAGLYEPHGLTAMVDATLLAVNDLKQTPEKYGDHAFLLYVFTDGIENDSTAAKTQPDLLRATIRNLPENWTVAALVPTQNAVFEAKKYGFPPDNIQLWDANTAAGLDEGTATIRQSTDNFMTARATGVRGTKSLFRLAEVSPSDIQATLVPITKGSYTLHSVAFKTRIDDFCKRQIGSYPLGKGYYQLTKRETIQSGKGIAIMTKGDIYTGAEARQLLGIPGDVDVRVTPDKYRDYKIFVQSTSTNRNLMPGTELLILR